MPCRSHFWYQSVICHKQLLAATFLYRVKKSTACLSQAALRRQSHNQIFAFKWIMTDGDCDREHKGNHQLAFWVFEMRCWRLRLRRPHHTTMRKKIYAARGQDADWCSFIHHAAVREKCQLMSHCWVAQHCASICTITISSAWLND